VIVGAGFAGLYMLHSARRLGLRAVIIEAGDDVGGTWYWNRYPGARCDTPSMEYSYGWDDELQQDWEWTEKYATQPEILSYLSHVADRFDLRGDIVFGDRVERCTFDEPSARWTVVTDDGVERSARFVVLATGCLSSANIPDIDGLDEFCGRTFHTGHWPHVGVDFTGRRVAVIGTGSSAVQSVPLIAAQADHVTVFQRTATYAVPAHNEPLDPEAVADIKHDYPNWRRIARDTSTGFGGHIPRRDRSALAVDEAERQSVYDDRWATGGLFFLGAFNDLLLDADANTTAADYVRKRIAAIVEDQRTAALLTPDTIIGCKRLCIDSGYYETFNRSNVSLVDVSGTPIERVGSEGVVVAGTPHPVDDLVFATGFDAMTGSIERIEITGRSGATLRSAWEAGPVSYLGLQVAGFPNLFTVTGPGSPSVLTNMVVSIEQHVEYIRDAVAALDRDGLATIEATEEAQTEWVAWVNAVADATLFPGCSSWYLGANVPGKPRVFMPLPGFLDYRDHCDEVAADGYRGFARA